MTTVTIFGQQPEVKQKKAIEFVKWMSPHGDFYPATRLPTDFKKVVLMRKANPYDTFYAYQSDPATGETFLGHFNDGFVEAQEEDTNDYKGKVEFYRKEMDKLREYLNANNIGRPNEKILDAVFNELKRLRDKEEERRYTRTELFAAVEKLNLSSDWRKAVATFINSLP